MPNKKIKTEIIMLPVPAELFLEAMSKLDK